MNARKLPTYDNSTFAIVLLIEIIVLKHVKCPNTSKMRG